MIPFIIPLLLTAAQIGKGISDNSKAKKQQAAADRTAAAIPKTDPGVKKHLSDIVARREYAENGQSRMLALKRQMIGDAGATASKNLVRSAGTAPGGAQQALLRNQKITQQGLASAGAESEALAPRYLQMETPLVSDIADRTLSLDTYLRDSQQFRASQRQQDGNNAITGGLGLAAALGVSYGKKTPDGDDPDLAKVLSQINGSAGGASEPVSSTGGFAWYGGQRPSWLQ